MSIAIAEKEARGDASDGLNAPEGVEYLARLAGWSGEGDLPQICIFDEEMGFSEITGFIRSSNGRGYYRTTLTACTCKSKLYRAAVVCKHQKALAERLERKARIDERNRQRRGEGASRDDDLQGHGFNMPPEGWR